MKMRIAFLSAFLILAALLAVNNTNAQSFDISSGGQPTITGALDGSVTGSSNVLDNLSVTVNFGEISPANANSIVKVVIPIAIRSISAYQVTVSQSGGTSNANPRSIQATDIGFGVNNMRSMGSGARACSLSSHIFYSPFNNDPASNRTYNASGRATYPSTLNNITGSAVILSGPQLTNSILSVSRATNNGYIFDAIFVTTPQYYAASSYSVTLTFTISAGPTAAC